MEARDFRSDADARAEAESASGQVGFVSTHWSAVLAARSPSEPLAQQALHELCAAYWYPLYIFIRRQGYSALDAQDLTQGFFEHLLSKDFLKNVGPRKGRFRSFLLACLKHYLADERDRRHAEKRDPGQPILSLDKTDAEERYRLEPADLRDAEKLYLRRWALDLLDRVLNRLKQDMVSEGKEDHYAVLEGCLLDEEEASYTDLAARMGTTEAAIKMMVYRMRKRYRKLFREEILQTVSAPEDVEEEMRYLLDCLNG
jgi:DNA-directed RNA polymerase specialized sigma24 family protein